MASDWVPHIISRLAKGYANEIFRMSSILSVIGIHAPSTKIVLAKLIWAIFAFVIINAEWNTHGGYQ